MTTDPVFLEFVNAVWFILGVCVLAVFVHYIWQKRENGYWNLVGAISIAAYWFGEVIARGGVWYWYHLINSRQPPGWIGDYPIAGAGGIIAAIGALCMIRVFSPSEFGNWVWIVSGALAMAFGLSVVL
jgi:hypothetical protein